MNNVNTFTLYCSSFFVFETDSIESMQTKTRLKNSERKKAQKVDKCTETLW